jgi:hypothetical protein
MIQVADHLPSKDEVLSSNPSTYKKMIIKQTFVNTYLLCSPIIRILI